MKRSVVRLMLAVVVLLALAPGVAVASFGDSPEVRAAKVQAQAMNGQAAASVEAARIYGTAIVVAGVAIGAGIYFAVRLSRKTTGGSAD